MIVCLENVKVFVWIYESSAIIEHIEKGVVFMEEKELNETEDKYCSIDDVADPNGNHKKRNKKKKEKKQGWKYEVLDIIKTVAICVVCMFLFTTFVLKTVRVDGKSMYPTLDNGDIGLMNVFSAKFQKIHRYDVVIVYNKEAKEDWVKRVIGLPGDTIYAKDDVVYVNGQPLDEPYLNTDYVKQIRVRGDKFTDDFDKVTLGKDQYFLMGDNRIVSYDSRRVGPFTRDEIRGKDVYVFYPFNHMKLVRNGDK